MMGILLLSEDHNHVLNGLYCENELMLHGIRNCGSKLVLVYSLILKGELMA